MTSFQLHHNYFISFFICFLTTSLNPFPSSHSVTFPNSQGVEHHHGSMAREREMDVWFWILNNIILIHGRILFRSQNNFDSLNGMASKVVPRGSLSGSWHEKLIQTFTKQSLIEQATTEVSIMQLAAGGLPVCRGRKYRNYEKRLVTIREKYEAGDYSLSELVKACSHWVSL